MPRFRGRSRPDFAAGSPARAILDAALPRSRELRLGSQQVREAEQQPEPLAVLLQVPVAHPCVPKVPLHVEKRMLSFFAEASPWPEPGGERRPLQPHRLTIEQLVSR